eukprot:Nitzschia sp. Nitz4//scaffold22_size323478//17917//19497//NITZ4_000493-RA/size323478-processed-gene-0.436-mRNA-1//-1//CDS//3329542893//2102//frame0
MDGPRSLRYRLGKRSRWNTVTPNRMFQLILATCSLLLVASMLATPATPHLRNPLHFPQRRLDESAIRYLSLGGPTTWGVGLEHPEPYEVEGVLTALDTAYPYRLSPDAHNAAQREGGPTLAALCTQSIVKDQVYDVVTVEFSRTTLSEWPALELLVRRLRQRFPNAVMVLVQTWLPSHYYQKDTGLNFATWRQQQSMESDWVTGNWKSAAMAQDWVYSEDALEVAVRLGNLAEKVQAELVHLAPPQQASRAMETAANWFLEVPTPSGALYTLSSKGHVVVANHIRSMIASSRIPILEQSAQERNSLGGWGSGDMCRLWYNTPNNVVPTTGSMSLAQFANQKYALEVGRSGGSIVVENPFDEDRMLYLTYMTSQAPSDHAYREYPRTKVQILSTTKDHESGPKSGIIVDPYHSSSSNSLDDKGGGIGDDDVAGYIHHLTRTSAVGMIPANTAVQVQFLPMESTTLPFRVVGAVFVAKDKDSQATNNLPTIRTEYTLEAERIPMGRRQRRLHEPTAMSLQVWERMMQN